MSLNESTRSTSTKKSLKWGFVNKILAILLPFATRTVIIHYLGVEFAGLGSLFTAVISVLSLAELGVGSALVFAMYKPVSENNIEKINAFLNFYKKCYRIIGAIVLSIGLCLFPLLPFLVSGEIPASVNLYLLYAIYLANTSISYFLFAYKSSILVATRRNDARSIIASIVLIAKELAQILLLIAFKNYYFYCICIPIFTVLDNLLVAIIVKKLYPEIKASGKLSKEEVHDIRERIVGLLFQKIGTVVLSSVDSIVISAFLGLKILGIYNSYYYIINALFGFFTIIQTSLIPAVGNSIVTSSKEKNYSDFKKFHFLYVWCCIFCSACLLSLFQPFMTMWIKEKNLLEFGVVALLPAYFFLYKLNDICYIYREAAGLWKEWKYVNIIAALVNLAVNIVLVQFIGLYGIVISTIVSLLFVYTPFFTYPLFDKYFDNKRFFWIYLRDCLFYILAGASITVLTYLICDLIDVTSFWLFALRCAVAVFASNAMILVFALIFRNGRSALAFVRSIVRRKQTR